MFFVSAKSLPQILGEKIKLFWDDIISTTWLSSSTWIYKGHYMFIASWYVNSIDSQYSVTPYVRLMWTSCHPAPTTELTRQETANIFQTYACCMCTEAHTADDPAFVISHYFLLVKIDSFCPPSLEKNRSTRLNLRDRAINRDHALIMLRI